MSESVIDIAIEPRSKADHERLVEVLRRFTADDAALRVTIDAGSGQVILSGRSEMHLDAVVDRLKLEVTVNIGAPQVAYREAITRALEHEHTHRTQSEFARIKFRIAPNQVGNEFLSEVVGANVPREYVPGVERA